VNEREEPVWTKRIRLFQLIQPKLRTALANEMIALHARVEELEESLRTERALFTENAAADTIRSQAEELRKSKQRVEELEVEVTRLKDR